MSRREFDAEDFVISDRGMGSRVYVGVAEGRGLGEFKTRAAAVRAICTKMHKDKFRPNVWHVNDHGNVTRLRLKCKVRK